MPLKPGCFPPALTDPLASSSSHLAEQGRFETYLLAVHGACFSPSPVKAERWQKDSVCVCVCVVFSPAFTSLRALATASYLWLEELRSFLLPRAPKVPPIWDERRGNL